MRVFWSWQSDKFPKECRSVIRAALSAAVDAAADDLDIADAERPELDSDTQGRPGMVDISATILGKIANAAVFVADVTPVGVTPNGKALPNPNVLVELGWAMHKPGYDRVIPIFNRAEGWKPEDLPFDIRHRRLLGYTLAPGADPAERAKVTKELTAALTAAIKVNLSAALTEKAEATEIVGVAARGGERSIWSHAVQDIVYHEISGAGVKSKVELQQGPRAYARFIPADWPSGVPSIAAIENTASELVLWPPAEGGTAGSYGPTDDGYVRFWGRLISGHTYHSANIAMFLEATGEYWVLHGTALDDRAGTLYFRPDATLRQWSETLDVATRNLDAFGASPVRKVELGVTGLSGARWANDHGVYPEARKSFILTERQARDWSPAAQVEFLRRAANEMRNAFSLPILDAAAFAQELRRVDPKRLL